MFGKVDIAISQVSTLKFHVDVGENPKAQENQEATRSFQNRWATWNKTASKVFPSLKEPQIPSKQMGDREAVVLKKLAPKTELLKYDDFEKASTNFFDSWYSEPRSDIAKIDTLVKEYESAIATDKPPAEVIRIAKKLGRELEAYEGNRNVSSLKESLKNVLAQEDIVQSIRQLRHTTGENRLPALKKLEGQLLAFEDKPGTFHEVRRLVNAEIALLTKIDRQESEFRAQKLPKETEIIETGKTRMEYLQKSRAFDQSAFHGTSSSVLDKIKGAGNKILSGKALQDKGIVRTTGEGTKFSTGNTEKRTVYIAKGPSGLGTSAAYSIASERLGDYNVARYTRAELEEGIKIHEKAALYYQGKINHPLSKEQQTTFIKVANETVERFKEEVQARGLEIGMSRDGDQANLNIHLSEASKFKAELQRRDKMELDNPAREGGISLREDDYPVLFEFDSTKITSTDIHHTGDFLRGEAVVDYELPLDGNMKRAYAPAAFVDHLKGKLEEMFPGQKIEVLPLESLDATESSSETRRSLEATIETLASKTLAIESNATALAGGMDAVQGGKDHIDRLEKELVPGLGEASKKVTSALEKYKLTPHEPTSRKELAQARKELRLLASESRRAIQFAGLYNLGGEDAVVQKEKLLKLEESVVIAEKQVETLYDEAQNILSGRPVGDKTPVVTTPIKLPTNRKEFATQFQSHVLDSHYKQLFQRRDKDGTTASQYASRNHGTPNFLTNNMRSQDKTLNTFEGYVDAVSLGDKVLPRNAHGSMHATRVSIFTEMLHNLFVTQGRPKLSDETLMMVQMAGGLHDAGRMDEGVDYYDPISASMTEEYFVQGGMQKQDAHNLASLVENKDAKPEFFTGMSPEGVLAHDLIHDADCLENIRTKGGQFDPSYLRCIGRMGKVHTERFVKEVEKLINVTNDAEIMKHLETHSTNYYGDVLAILEYTQSQDSTRFPTMHKHLTEALKTKTELSGPLKELVDNRIKVLWPPVTL